MRILNNLQAKSPIQKILLSQTKVFRFTKYIVVKSLCYNFALKTKKTNIVKSRRKLKKIITVATIHNSLNAIEILMSINIF